MTTAGVGTLPATARDLGNATAAYAWLADLKSVKETYDGMEFAMMYSDSEAKRPTLLLLSTDGTMNTHVVREVRALLLCGLACRCFTRQHVLSVSSCWYFRQPIHCYACHLRACTLTLHAKSAVSHSLATNVRHGLPGLQRRYDHAVQQRVP
eukprot:1794823-Rhodomonas_salina.1